MILPGLSLGLSSPRFGAIPGAAVVAQLAPNSHVSAYRGVLEQPRISLESEVLCRLTWTDQRFTIAEHISPSCVTVISRSVIAHLRCKAACGGARIIPSLFRPGHDTARSPSGRARSRLAGRPWHPESYFSRCRLRRRRYRFGLRLTYPTPRLDPHRLSRVCGPVLAHPAGSNTGRECGPRPGCWGVRGRRRGGSG